MQIPIYDDNVFCVSTFLDMHCWNIFRPEVMDRAILRPGRLGKLLYVPLPSPDERGQILRALAKKNKRIDSSVDLMAIGRESACKNLSGADLSALVGSSSLSSFLFSSPNDCIHILPFLSPPWRWPMLVWLLLRRETSYKTEVQMLVNGPSKKNILSRHWRKSPHLYPTEYEKIRLFTSSPNNVIRMSLL